MPQEREAVGAGTGELHALQRPRERRPSPTAGERESRAAQRGPGRSEEHTSELQSLAYLVCRLLLEKKKARRENLAGVPDGLRSSSDGGRRKEGGRGDGTASG